MATWLMALGAADGWRTPLLVLLLILWGSSWLAAIIDITRSRFRSIASRRRWVAVVTLVPLLGFLLYWAMGKHYKENE